jgi:hypothetical protein
MGSELMRQRAPAPQRPATGGVQHRPAARAVSWPGGRFEKEADRAAAAVIDGGRAPAAFSLSTVPIALVQRQEAGEEKTDEEKYRKAGGKLGEAFLETPLGKELVEKARQDKLVKGAAEAGKSFIGTLPGKIITGAVAAGAVATLAAAHKELPARIPEIPLDALRPGLSVEISYKGPIDRPTEATITFKFSEQPPVTGGARKPALTESEKFRAETARIAADQARFRAGLKFTPGSREDLEQKAGEAAALRAAARYAGGPDLAAMITNYPWLGKQPPGAGLQLTLPAPSLGYKPSPLLGDEYRLRLPGEKKKEDEPALQRKAADTDTMETAPPIVDRALASPGRPLDAGTRAFMASRFSHDFGRVRIHDDALAADSARAVRARAYTVGQHIVFAAGQYRPHTRDGAGLLAHELAHTVQQGGQARTSAGGRLGVSPAGDTAEREAASAAYDVMLGLKPALVIGSSLPVLRRAPWGTCPTGERVSALPEKVNQKAELAIVTYYETVARDKTYVISNRKRIEEFFLKPHLKHNKMLTAMNEMFRSDRPGFISPTEIVSLEEAGEIAAPGVETTDEGEPIGASSLAAIEGRERSAVEPEPELKRPDIADLETREIYDVTTIGQADAKVAKIADTYVAKLNRLRDYYRIGGKPWTAGTTLQRPPAHYLLYRGLSPGPDEPAICFGLTDFTLRPGVIVYEPIKLPASSAAITVTEPYVVATKAGKKATIDANFAPSATDLLNTGANNMGAARIIRGLVFKTLKRGKTPAKDRITACVVSEGCIQKAGQPAIPIAITSGNGEIELKVDPKTRVISLAESYAGYKFKSKHLSEGTLTKFDIDSEEEGARGAGKLKPSLSIFKGLEFGVELSETRYAVTAGLEEDRVKQILKPIPGARVTKAQLAIDLYPAFNPRGELAMEVKSGQRSILDASVTVKPGPTGGLYAGGVLNAYIPGTDKAEGKVIYDAGQWSAYARLEATRTKLPYVSGGQIEAGFNAKGPYGDGLIDLTIPAGNSAQVGLHYRDRRWYFSGKGKFNIRRIGSEVGLTIDFFDGETLKGSGTVKGFKFKGLTGDFTVHYAGRTGAPRPRIWGDGRFDIKKGSVAGSLAARLLETGKFAGEGSISYQIRPGLVANAGISLDENEKVKLTGALTFPTYTLIEKFPKSPRDRVDLFTFGPKDIGVPYLSFGPAGLQARIRAGVFATYSVGPALLVGGFIKTVIDNPLDEKPDVDLELGGKISLPVSFRVTGFIAGGLVLDLLVAEAGGEIIITTTVALDGEAGSNLWVHYGKGKFEARADFSVLLKLLLALCFDAYAWAAAGVWRFKVTTGKSWHLGHFPYDPGLQLGMRTTRPLYYSSETGFDADGLLDSIEWIKPRFDVGNALKTAFGATGGSEAEGKPKPNPCPKFVPDDED